VSRSRQVAGRLSPWLAGLLLAAGAVALVQRASPEPKSVTPPPAQRPASKPSVPDKNKKVPLDPAVRKIAGRFILTAVRRQHLDEAWKIAGPDIRQGLTYKQWLTGNIAVIPYTAPIGFAPLHVVYSHPREALLEVVLIPKRATSARAQDFFLGLIKIRRNGRDQWVVNYWVPRAAPAVPLSPSG
jgi:hypothetical protein